MKNLVITVRNQEGRQGQNYRSFTAKLDDKQIYNSTAGYGITNFTEEAIQKVIHSAILDDFTPVELTVTSPLSEGTKTAIVDKYAADPLITSIQFA